MINLPKQCEVNKIIPKSVIYSHVNISNNLKKEFVNKIGKIYWKYKISEDIINIAKTDEVEEIEVFELVLKEKYNCKNIINIITKSIPYQILFVIKYDEEFQYAIKYEDKIYFSEWNEDLNFDFTGLNLKSIYDNIIKEINNIDESKNDIDYELSKRNDLYQLENEIKKLENKMKSEVQFNKKVELNEQILKLKKELEELKNNG